MTGKGNGKLLQVLTTQLHFKALMFSKRREPTTQWQDAKPQHVWIFIKTAMRTLNLATKLSFIRRYAWLSFQTF